MPLPGPKRWRSAMLHRRSLQTPDEEAQAGIDQPALDNSAAAHENARLFELNGGASEDGAQLGCHLGDLALLSGASQPLAAALQGVHHPRTSSHRITIRSLVRGSSSNCRTIRLRPFHRTRWSSTIPSRCRIVTRYLGIELSACASASAPTLSSVTAARLRHTSSQPGSCSPIALRSETGRSMMMRSRSVPANSLTLVALGWRGWSSS